MTGTDLEVGAGSAARVAGFEPEPARKTRASTTIFSSGQQPAGAGCRPAAIVLRGLGEHDETEAFRIALIDEAGQDLLDLGVFGDEDAVAIWRSLAATSGLPLVIAGYDGTLEFPFLQIGPLRLGPIRIRRRFAVLSGRRPRFLVRRKSARLPRRPLVYREPEIAAGDAG